MSTFCTIVPLHKVRLATDQQFELAEGLLLSRVPSWVVGEQMLHNLSNWDQQAMRRATHAFIATYEASALGDPDPTWTADNRKSIQQAKYEQCVLANLALWLSKPSPAGFTVVIHAPDFGDGPVGQQVQRHSPLLCHPRDLNARVTANDMDLVGILHRSLIGIGLDSAIWTAVRATWAGLQMNILNIRYSLFWMALEALFGPENAGEITYRLSQRVGLFLGDDRAEARELFSVAKKSYGFRSKIVHGHWKKEADSENRMAETEDLVRRSLRRVLQDDALMETFSGKKREAFLDDLVFLKEAKRG